MSAVVAVLLTNMIDRALMSGMTYTESSSKALCRVNEMSELF